MTVSRKSDHFGNPRAFSLIEIVVVLAVISVLMAAGVSFVSNSARQSRRSACDALVAFIEEGRSAAITSRSTVLLAIAEPGDLAQGDGRCHVGLIQVSSWESTGAPAQGVLLRRWEALPAGVVLLDGTVDGLRNPLDEPEIPLGFGSGQQAGSASLHVIGFNPLGGLKWPEGSDPLILRVAEGGYRGGRRSPDKTSDGAVAESRIRIGRVVARPFRSL